MFVIFFQHRRRSLFRRTGRRIWRFWGINTFLNWNSIKELKHLFIFSSDTCRQHLLATLGLTLAPFNKNVKILSYLDKKMHGVYLNLFWFWCLSEAKHVFYYPPLCYHFFHSVFMLYFLLHSRWIQIFPDLLACFLLTYSYTSLSLMWLTKLRLK